MIRPKCKVSKANVQKKKEKNDNKKIQKSKRGRVKEMSVNGFTREQRIYTHQGRWTRGIVRRLSSSDQDRRYLVPGKVACVEVSLHNGGQETLLVL